MPVTSSPADEEVNIDHKSGSGLSRVARGSVNLDERIVVHVHGCHVAQLECV